MIAAQELIDRVLAASRADDVIVLVTDASEASLRWAGNSMTTNGASTSRSWSVISVRRDGGKAAFGSVSSTSVDPATIGDVVRASETAASAAPFATDAMPLITGAPTAPTWADGPGSTDITVFDGVAAELAEAFRGADRLYGFAHHQVHSTWLATSTGVRAHYVEPTGSIEINGKRGAGPAESSAWAGTATNDFTDVDTTGLVAELARRLDWANRKIALPAGRYETILPPSAVADLMIYLYWTMEGRSAEEGHSAFAAPTGGTRIGERLSTIPLTLYTDPAAPGLGFTPFVATSESSDLASVFDNGMPIRRTNWIADGVISQLVYPRAAASEFGAAPAALGNNLLMTGGSGASIDDMVASTGRGLLLTTLWYIREVDPTNLLLTGLTRDGVYLVEDGQVTGAVNNFRFNESPLDLLRRATEAGATVPALPREWKDWFTKNAMPALRIPDFHMSSVSKAT